VDAARIDAHTLSLVVDTMWRSSYDVTVTPDGAAGQLAVYVGAAPTRVVLNGRRGWAAKTTTAPSGSGPQRIMAPMPGKIVRVLVAAGDVIRAKQPARRGRGDEDGETSCAPGRDGTVAEVHAREGASVDAGALLVVIQ